MLMRFKQLLYSINPYQDLGILIRQIADLIVIFIACFLAVLFIKSENVINEIFLQSLSLLLLLSLVFIPTFYIKGIYTHGRNLPVSKKLLKLIQACLLSGVFILIIFYIFKLYLGLTFTLSELLISDLTISWFFTVFGSIFSRIWLYSYINTNPEPIGINDNNKKVLVIGGGGYIGSSVVEQLLDKQYRVRVLDIFLFGEEPIAHLYNNKNLEIIRGDFRKIDDLVMAVADCYAVVHLGGIVGDPACSVDEKFTKDVNLTASKIIGQIAKAAGVSKFIFASSCSVYGAQDSILDEHSVAKPLSLYARTKIASERVLSELRDDIFTPIFLRFGTVYGFSGRTRFDLVANLLTANAYTKKTMTIYGKDQTRPFVHVSDAAYSIVCALETKLSSNDYIIFNIGSNAQNCTLLELAEMIQKQIPDASIITEEGGDDARNYNVSFNRAEDILGFKTKWTLEGGIKQVIQKFESGEIEDYSQSLYSNVKHLHELHEKGLITLSSDELFNWEEAFLEETYG